MVQVIKPFRYFISRKEKHDSSHIYIYISEIDTRIAIGQNATCSNITLLVSNTKCLVQIKANFQSFQSKRHFVILFVVSKAVQIKSKVNYKRERFKEKIVLTVKDV